jgi:hypothetical protein
MQFAFRLQMHIIHWKLRIELACRYGSEAYNLLLEYYFLYTNWSSQNSCSFKSYLGK